MNWKNIVRKTFNVFGYNIYKIVDGEYTLCPPYGYSTYSPWTEKWFQEIYKNIINNTLVSEDRCYMIHMFSKYCLNLDGNFAECGVYKGGTAYLIAYTLNTKPLNNNKYLHIFDTFSGMPNTAIKEQDSHKEGDFGDVSLQKIQKYLFEYSNIIFHQGLIPETFSPVENETFSFVHVDVDIYSTTIDCCQFFYNRLIRGGIMLFDDYGFPQYKNAEKRAVDDFFCDKPENPISLRTGQCFIIKL